MGELSRRDALKTGVALVAGARSSEAFDQTSAGRRVSTSASAATLAAARAAAQLARRGVQRRWDGPVREALVFLCRSWDRQAYLFIDEALKGFVTLDEPAFAVAAACQAAGRPIAVRFWDHDPLWCEGVGRFGGALLAVDANDLEKI